MEVKKIGLFNFLNKEDIETRSDDIFDAVIKGNTYNRELSEEEVLSIPTVQAIMEIIGGTIAQLPIYLYKEDKDGSVERIRNDRREFLLNNEPNEFTSSYIMKKNMVKDYLLYGEHRIYKKQIRNYIEALYPLESDSVTINKFYEDSFILKTYKINVNGEGGFAVLNPEEVISILKESKDGIEGIGALKHGKDLFALMYSEIEYQKGIYENGAMPAGIICVKGRLAQDTINRLRLSWQNLYKGGKNAAKTVILEEGMDYRPTTMNPRDLLLNEARKENISEVCRLFNIPESLVNSESNKYGSLEQNNISFLQYTLSPIMTAIEDALNKHLLLETEKEEGYFWNFDTAEVLKTTEKEKYEAIKTSLDSGVITINEARSRLNMRPVKDDVMKWSLGAVLYNPDDGTMMIPNMGIGIPGYTREGEHPIDENPKGNMLEKDKEDKKNEEIEEEKE